MSEDKSKNNKPAKKLEKMHKAEVFMPFSVQAKKDKNGKVLREKVDYKVGDTFTSKNAEVIRKLKLKKILK